MKCAGSLNEKFPMPEEYISKTSSTEEGDVSITKKNPDYVLPKRSVDFFADGLRGLFRKKFSGWLLDLKPRQKFGVHLRIHSLKIHKREFFLLQSLQMHSKTNYTMSKYIRIFKIIMMI